VALIEQHFELVETVIEKPIWVSDQYREAHNNAAGINVRYAIQTLEQGTVERWSIPGQTDVILATEVISVGKPYLQVVLGHTGTPGKAGTALMAGWRLYEADAAWRPRDAFAAVLDRYGVDIVAGDLVGRFIAHEFIENVGDEGFGMGFANFDESEGRAYSSSALFRRTAGGEPDELSWAYAIDDVAYADDVRRHRGLA